MGLRRRCRGGERTWEQTRLRWPAGPFLLCDPVPNRPRTGSGPAAQGLRTLPWRSLRPVWRGRSDMFLGGMPTSTLRSGICAHVAVPEKPRQLPRPLPGQRRRGGRLALFVRSQWHAVVPEVSGPPRPQRLAQQPPAPGASLPAGARAAVPRCSSVPCALCLLCVQTRCDVHTLTTATQLPAVFGPATCCVGVWPGNHSRAQACSGLCPPGVCKCPCDVHTTTESQKDTFLRTCPIVK